MTIYYRATDETGDVYYYGDLTMAELDQERVRLRLTKAEPITQLPDMSLPDSAQKLLDAARHAGLGFQVAPELRYVPFHIMTSVTIWGLSDHPRGLTEHPPESVGFSWTGGRLHRLRGPSLTAVHAMIHQLTTHP